MKKEERIVQWIKITLMLLAFAYVIISVEEIKDLLSQW